MRRSLAIAALLLALAACGDSAATTTATEAPPDAAATAPATTAAPATTTTAAPVATTTLAPTTTQARSTTTGAAEAARPDIEAITDCDGLVDAALALLQAVFDDLGDMTLDDLDAAGGTAPALDAMAAEGEKLDAKTTELGCDPAELEAGLVARLDELEPRGDLGELILSGLAGEEPDPEPAEVPEGVALYEVADRSHTDDPVDYPQDPPVGGPHRPVWQNCGFYAEPVVTEHAVHSLEHGAIWVTYDPAALDEEELAALRDLADQPKVLVSPYDGLGSTPVVASAWGAQLRLESATDPRLEQFVAALRDAGAPEPGAPCQDGVGVPG